MVLSLLMHGVTGFPFHSIKYIPFGLKNSPSTFQELIDSDL